MSMASPSRRAITLFRRATRSSLSSLARDSDARPGSARRLRRFESDVAGEFAQASRENLRVSRTRVISLRELVNDQHLSRIHPVIRVQGALERAHHIEGRRTVLDFEIFHLPESDTVLAGTRSPQTQRPHDEAFVQLAGSG